MEKIPFAQFILNDIAANGAFLGYTWGFNDYEPIARKSLMTTEPTRGTTIAPRTSKDDWSYEAGWTLFGFYANIYRGTEENSFFFTVRGELACKLLVIQDEFWAARKAKNKATKIARKKKELDAEWWP